MNVEYLYVCTYLFRITTIHVNSSVQWTMRSLLSFLDELMNHYIAKVYNNKNRPFIRK